MPVSILLIVEDVIICFRRNKDKFEYTVQAKAWKQVKFVVLQLPLAWQTPCLACQSSLSHNKKLQMVHPAVLSLCTCQAVAHDTKFPGQVVEGLGIKEGDLLEFELTLERNLKVTVMKSSTVTRKPKKMAPSELASIAKKKAYRNLPMDQLSRSMMLTGQEGILPDLLLPAAAAAAASGMPIRLPDVSAAQVPQLHRLLT